jgi:hypothetical protein
MQVAGDPLAVRPLGEPAQVGLPCRLERRQPGGAAAGRRFLNEPQVAERIVDPSLAFERRPVGTIGRVARGLITCSSTCMAPAPSPSAGTACRR